MDNETDQHDHKFKWFIVRVVKKFMTSSANHSKNVSLTKCKIQWGNGATWQECSCFTMLFHGNRTTEVPKIVKWKASEILP